MSSPATPASAVAAATGDAGFAFSSSRSVIGFGIEIRRKKYLQPYQRDARIKQTHPSLILLQDLEWWVGGLQHHRHTVRAYGLPRCAVSSLGTGLLTTLREKTRPVNEAMTNCVFFVRQTSRFRWMKTDNFHHPTRLLVSSICDCYTHNESGSEKKTSLANYRVIGKQKQTEVLSTTLLFIFVNLIHRNG